MSRKIVLATVGLCGVGKSSVTERIRKKFGFSSVYFGGQITREVERRGMVVNAENERLVREELRVIYGMDAISRLAAPEVERLLDTGNPVVIDGLYSYAELVYLQEKLQANVVTIAIHARKKIRYERMAIRPVRPLTNKEVDERDKREIAALDKATPIALADYHIVNDALLDEMNVLVDQAVLDAFPSILPIAS